MNLQKNKVVNDKYCLSICLIIDLTMYIHSSSQYTNIIYTHHS